VCPRFCKHCGSPLEPGLKFCEACGKPVEAPAQQQPMPSPLGQAPGPAIPSEAARTADAKAIRRHSASFYIIWVGLTVLGILLFSGLLTPYGLYIFLYFPQFIHILAGMVVLIVGFTAKFWWSRWLALIAIVAILWLLYVDVEILWLPYLGYYPGLLRIVGALILLAMSGLRVAGRV